VFEPGQFVMCFQYYACGSTVRDVICGIVVEKQDVWGYDGYLVLEQGKFKPVRYNAEEIEDYEEFLERQNKFKNESSGV